MERKSLDLNGEQDKNFEIRQRHVDAFQRRTEKRGEDNNTNMNGDLTEMNEESTNTIMNATNTNNPQDSAFYQFLDNLISNDSPLRRLVFFEHESERNFNWDLRIEKIIDGFDVWLKALLFHS